MKKTIEFQQSKSSTADLLSRWPKPKSQFEDLILTPVCSDAKAKLPQGTCSIRVLPAIKGGQRWWMPIHALTYSGGQHAHPKTTDPSAKSVFDEATAWFKQNAPTALYTKSAGKGFQLWSQPMAACWLLVTCQERTEFKLLVASAFAGTTERQSGLAHQLMEFVRAHQQLLDPDAKCEIEVTRSLPEGGRYLETAFRVLESAYNLNECIAKLPSEQTRMVCPVEQAIRRIEPDDEWVLLEKAIGTQWVDRIRDSSTKISPEESDSD